jgi:hypothetical protein
MNNAACRNATRAAIKNGTLIKEACQVCGDVDVQAHHTDYNKPMDITWLCDKHHRELHREKPEITPGDNSGTKVFAINMTDEAIKLLDDLARQSFRTRSAEIRFLVEQELARQIAAANSLPAPVVYPQKGE